MTVLIRPSRPLLSFSRQMTAIDRVLAGALVMIMFTSAAIASPPESRGKVVDVTGKSIVAEFELSDVGKSGDLVRIALEVPRVGLLDLEGRWRVVRVEGKRVFAEAVGKTDQPRVGQVAFILAGANSQQDSGQVSESVELLGETLSNADGIPMVPSTPSPGQIPEGTAPSPDEQPGILIDLDRFNGAGRIPGKVVDVRGSEIRVQLEGPYRPRLGNRVILISRSGGFITTVGEGQISRLESDNIWATVTHSGIAPHSGLLVEIEVEPVTPTVGRAQPSAVQDQRTAPESLAENTTQSADDYLVKGRSYAFPKSGQPDYAAAIPYLRKAAEMGSIPASYELSWVYLQDKSLLDQKEALAWLRRAADEGYPDAEFLLGLLYEGEFDVLEPNLHLASEWLRRASAHGHAKARKRMWKLAFPDSGIE